VFVVLLFVGIYIIIVGLLPVFPGLSGSENTDYNSPSLDNFLIGFFIIWGSLVAAIFGYKILTRPEKSKPDGED
jgi:hypothetical protein